MSFLDLFEAIQDSTKNPLDTRIMAYYIPRHFEPVTHEMDELEALLTETEKLKPDAIGSG